VDEATSLLALIGTRVSRRRATLQLSLEQLAEQTGVSRSMISRIERGEVHASAVVLDRLCAGLGTSLSELFARDAASPLLRRADQPVWKDPASRYIRREVAAAGTGSPVKIVEVEFPAGAEVKFNRTPTRALEQHVWVLDGELEIVSSGVTYNLFAGDCLHMRLVDGNTFRNRSRRRARYVVILASKESTHL
jgi:transcriptional regulator with XRE-family HTH domain